MGRAIEGIINHARRQILKAGLKLLPVGPFIELLSGAGQLRARHVAALLGGELERAPVRQTLHPLVHRS